MDKILITGGSGLLGFNWANNPSNEYTVVVGLHKRIISSSEIKTLEINLNSQAELTETLTILNPDVVVHAVAITSIEYCESHPDLAERINADLARNVAVVCRRLNIKLVHISTDQLYSDNKLCHRENDPLSPINRYGITKALAEEYVLSEDESALVIRSNFFGWGPPYRRSFSDFIIDGLSKGESVRLFTDVFYTPIYSIFLIDMIIRLVKSNKSGLYNVVSRERVSKYSFGKMIEEIFEFEAGCIVPDTIKARAGLVVRPTEMSLSVDKLEDAVGVCVNSLRSQLELLRSSKKSTQPISWRVVS